MEHARKTLIRLALGAAAAGTLLTGCGVGDEAQSAVRDHSSVRAPATPATVETVDMVEFAPVSEAGSLVAEHAAPTANPVVDIPADSEKLPKGLSGPSNTAISSNYAYLQSNGICGGASTGFDISSEGFEYLQIGVAYLGQTAVTWGPLTQVAANVRQHYALPIARQNKVYVVVGWDWTGFGWENRVVLTSFDHILEGYFSTWFC